MAPVSASTSTRLPSSTHLDDTIDRGGTLQDGSHGADVQEAQRILQAQGFSPGRVDGQFGNGTKSAVEAFQRSRGIAVDGIVGPETLRELRTPIGAGSRASGATGINATSGNRIPGSTGADFQNRAQLDQSRRSSTAAPTTSTTSAPGSVTLAPAGASEAQKYAHYSAIVKANGGQVCPDGKPTVLGVRGMDIHGNRHDSNTSARSYNETFVVLTPDGHCREFKGATHPGQNTSTQARDDNGTRGVGIIDTGNFKVVPHGPHAGAASFEVRTLRNSGNLPGVRDTNGDGHMSASEAAASARRGDTLTGVLFHQGNPDTPSSIGCQTLDPDTYKQFLRSVGSRGFSYSLVDANK